MPTQQEESFDDLPLFHVPRYLQIWESLPEKERMELTDLLPQLFLEYVDRRRSTRKGDESDE